MEVREAFARQTGQKLLDDLEIAFVPVDVLEICRQRRIIVDWSCRVDHGCDAITFRDPNNDRYGIYLSNRPGCIQRFRFTLAHELSHCILSHFIEFDLSLINCPELGRSTAWVLNREANICSEEILMPESFIISNAYHGMEYLKSACGVSQPAMEIRLKSLGITAPRRELFSG